MLPEITSRGEMESMIYFTSDLHFGHSNIIRHCNRPFRSVKHMDDVLIQNWNTKVSNNDEIYILGDFTMEDADTAHRYFTLLNGKKYLIRGNHDKFAGDYERYMEDVIWIKDYYVLSYQKRKFILFHYPILEWEDYGKDSIHLYGHIHNNMKSVERVKMLGKNACNVGVDVNHYAPVSIEEILRKR